MRWRTLRVCLGLGWIEGQGPVGIFIFERLVGRVWLGFDL
jgi:hypothetical protein